MGRADNATTGKFLKQTHELHLFEAQDGDDLLALAQQAFGAADFVVIDAPRDDLLAVADLAQAQGKLLFNAGAPDGDLRSEACRANLFHTLPSRAMRADALAQFALRKSWKSWALITGPRAEDAAFATALEGAATKFGLKITSRKD